MRIILIIGRNGLSEIIAETLLQAVKAVELSTSMKLDVEIMQDEEVVYPVIKINDLSPIVVKSPPDIRDLVRIIRANVEIRELVQDAEIPSTPRGQAISKAVPDSMNAFEYF
ncbi:hypothetical protein [Desulfurococcus amylolyticus]|uniref:Uncharacterized protein n=1 Tax=Desulfurococcus amylolyticus DSM 16532 TaxID=768672 RepID=I3XQ32_DESAM|nr:hypothetical protein [Desulfurococcus amylolyticus]AFL66056.1 hypothetical protein Desfe_0143 [Desulfurococcus amylolyticus DSM 16532]